MRKIRCYECGKSYDYDMDDFCPRCGAFTQPYRERRIGADGQVVRVDGINERYHKKSFVHAELHEENKARRDTRLEQAAPRERTNPLRPAGKAASKRENTPKAFVWAVIAAILLTIIQNIF